MRRIRKKLNAADLQAGDRVLATSGTYADYVYEITCVERYHVWIGPVGCVVAYSTGMVDKWLSDCSALLCEREYL